jgi:hypothetical protein
LTNSCGKLGLLGQFMAILFIDMVMVVVYWDWMV